MVIKIGICDDTEDIRTQYTEYLERYQKEAEDLSFAITVYSSGNELLRDNTAAMDILFLDIEMPGLDGLEVARILKQRNQDLCILFVTAYPQYAIEGYKVHAFSFLKKPLVYPAFSREIASAISLVKRNRGRQLYIKNGGIITAVNVQHILYIEVIGHDVSIVLNDGRQPCSATLGELEKQLQDDPAFFRCHKSYLVNFKWVASITNDQIEMANGDMVLLSRYRRKEFMKKFTEFAGNYI